MCGICAYIGKGDASEPIYRAIYALQNRGYDSMGLAYFCQGEIAVDKKASTEEKKGIEWMYEWTREPREGPMMGHARWATCGAKSDANSHPHLCWRSQFAVVHNGIIENYRSLRDWLSSQGVTFSSETDTEVIVNLISYYSSRNEDKDIDRAIREALSRLEGTWGIVVMARTTPNHLYCARHGSPLLIGFGEDYLMVSSEQSGFANYVNNYIALRENDIVVLTSSGELITAGGTEGTVGTEEGYEVRPVTCAEVEFSPAPFPHWTLREIYEQPDSVSRALSGGGRLLSGSEVRLGGLAEHRELLLDIEHLIILGCGTSYHAGLYALETFRRIGRFSSVWVLDGADFDESYIVRPPLGGKGRTGLILLSQSGETKDLHRALEIGRQAGLPMIGVVNAVDSLIAREVDCGVYLNAGREVGVASTKSFTSQVVVLSLIACWFSQNRSGPSGERERIIEGLRALPRDIETMINWAEGAREGAREGGVQEVVGVLVDASSAPFILGKGESEAIAREGALKIKELSYIRAEAYPSSSLKHGPYSCLEEGTPVILLAPRDRHAVRNEAIYDELKARGAYVITIGDGQGDLVLKVPHNRYFEPLLATIYLQLIAYHCAVRLALPVDFPRGIAKCVTTD